MPDQERKRRMTPPIGPIPSKTPTRKRKTPPIPPVTTVIEPVEGERGPRLVIRVPPAEAKRLDAHVGDGAVEVTIVADETLESA